MTGWATAPDVTRAIRETVELLVTPLVAQIDAERARADRAEKRADDERELADRERDRADRAEKRVAELEVPPAKPAPPRTRWQRLKAWRRWPA